MSYQVRFTEEAQTNLDQLYDFLVSKDVAAAEKALAAIEQALKMLETFPFSFRKAAGGRHGPFLRELLISFGASGYVALYEISGRTEVTVLAVRHQRESDYH